MLNSAYQTLRDRGGAVLLRAVYNLFKSNFQKLVLGRSFVNNRIHNYRMLLDTNDMGISRSLILFGTREVDHKIILEKVLRPGMTVLDIGANIGYYALMELNLIGDTGTLIAVEPSPANIDLLKSNLALNNYPGVEVIEGAVSDHSGVKLFHLANQSNLHTFHDVGTGVAHLSGEDIEVKTMTVPEVMNGRGLDLIRMDVEGHEVEVINGMLEEIRSGKLGPMIIFETHISRYSAEHDMEKALRDLFACGYHTRYLSSSYQRGTALINARGYKGSDPVQTDGVERVIYENIKDEDAVDFICHTGGARTVLIQPKK